MSDLRAIAASLPSMGGVEIGPLLERLASEVPKDQTIVEVGCWLGAGTAHLALGAMKSAAPIHVYDRWRTHRNEVPKAARHGVDINEGQDTLPLVQAALRPFGVKIHWHRCDIRRARWLGSPIGLYVDDASKGAAAWKRASRTFLRCVAVGGVAALMDYHFHETAGPGYLSQKRYMEARADRFEMIEDRPAGSTCAVFRRIA